MDAVYLFNYLFEIEILLEFKPFNCGVIIMSKMQGGDATVILLS